MTGEGPAIDFSSNDYLGLASDPRLARAAQDVLLQEGVGAAASRLIAGDHPEHEALETEIAKFLGLDAALSFGSGYAANTGAIPALVGPNDLLLSDALNHASLIDGCRLSRATVRVFPHADAGAVREILAAERGKHPRAMIVTDGVFSMDGDMAPLPELVSVAREFDAWTYVDDAHAVGVLGQWGRGTPEALGVHGMIDVVVGTMGKAFGAAGAYACGSRTLIEHLLNRARSFVFSTAMLPAQAAAARMALRIARSEPERRHAVRDVAAALRTQIGKAGLDVPGEHDAHIIPVVMGDAASVMRAGAALREQGLLVGAVRPPTVPEGSSRLRISASAAHTPTHVRRLAGTLASVLSRVANTA
jgi:8-amino-7-oxononanoate synthase